MLIGKNLMLVTNNYLLFFGGLPTFHFLVLDLDVLTQYTVEFRVIYLLFKVFIRLHFNRLFWFGLCHKIIIVTNYVNNIILQLGSIWLFQNLIVIIKQS